MSYTRDPLLPLGEGGSSKRRITRQRVPRPQRPFRPKQGTPGMHFPGQGTAAVFCSLPSPSSLSASSSTGTFKSPWQSCLSLMTVIFHKTNKPLFPTGVTAICTSHLFSEVRPTSAGLLGPHVLICPSGLWATLVLCQGHLPSPCCPAAIA